MSEAARRVGALLDLGRDVDAAAAAREQLAGNPHDIDLLVCAALAWVRTGELAAADWAARRALGLDPDGADTHRIATIVARHVDDGPRAVQLAERTVVLAPLWSEAHVELAHACAAFGDNHALRRGLTAAHEAIRLSPHDAAAHNALGAVELARGRANDAATAFDRALELEPATAIYHSNAAVARHRSGDLRAAGRHAVAAGRSSPGDERPIDDLRRFHAESFDSARTGWSLLGFTVALAALCGLILTSTDTGSRTTVLIAVGVVYVAVVATIVARAARARRLDTDARAVIRADRDLRRPR